MANVKILAAQQAFNPHITFNINHLNNSTLHPDVFNVTWWQDAMPLLRAGKPLPWRPRDLIYTFGQELYDFLHQCGAPRIERQPFCYSDEIFKNRGRERKPKAVVIASSYRNNAARYPKAGALIATLEAMFETGAPLTDAVLAHLSAQHGYTERAIFWDLWHYVIRDRSVHWLCALSDLLEVEVYGRYWEKDPVVRPFFKGELPHGEAVATVYNEALYTLVPHPFDLQSQRLMEAAACGAIPLVYDCRYRAEKPHWDDHYLWYHTPETLRACVTKRPSAPLQEVCHGNSHTEFAMRILTEVNTHVSRRCAASPP